MKRFLINTYIEVAIWAVSKTWNTQNNRFELPKIENASTHIKKFKKRLSFYTSFIRKKKVMHIKMTTVAQNQHTFSGITLYGLPLIINKSCFCSFLSPVSPWIQTSIGTSFQIELCVSYKRDRSNESPAYLSKPLGDFLFH